MSNDLLKKSLMQGKQFNNYQTKITKPINKNRAITKQAITEGFVSSEQEIMLRPEEEGYSSVIRKQQGTNLIDQSIQTDINELQQLQSKYSDLIQQYTSIQKSIDQTSLSSISRVSPSNPYLGKLINFQDGTICYVTNQGVAKPITSWDVYLQMFGANGIYPGIPVVAVSMPWQSDYQPGVIIPTTPTLITGAPIQLGQGIGNEGSNVFVNTLLKNPRSDYIGCYNNKPPATNVNVVPVMGSTNEVNGFIAMASSVYQNNNGFTGPWCAFDNNINTWWHSNTDGGYDYDGNTGKYKGRTNINIIDSNGQQLNVAGEYLQIALPNISIAVTKYSIQGRQGCCGQPNGRDPNTWYILGNANGNWYAIDYQTNIKFDWKLKTFDILNPQVYGSYLILTTIAGDEKAPAGSRSCVQIATFNLFSDVNSQATSNNRAMTAVPESIGFTSFDNCQHYAVDNGYQYFGMQDYKTDGTATCLVSNDITRTQMYGDSSKQTTIVPMWSTNTAGSNATGATLGSTGILSLSNNVWKSGDKDPANCGIQYSLTEKSDAPGNDLSHYTNVTLDYCKSECTSNKQCYGVGMNTANNNECWLKSQFQKISGNNNSRALYKKVQSTTSNCKFILILQDDGNMCIYQGTVDNIIPPALWCTMSNGKQLQPNSDWEASKSSFGRHYMIEGETLSVNQWIGSPNGLMKLIMQPDGNLILYTSETKSGCINSNNKTYGGPGVNAVYKLSSVGNTASLGKVGYIDGDSTLKEYPDLMLELSNNYQIYQNSDSGGNDIGIGFETTDQNGCQTACNNNADCAAYVYVGPSSSCFLKNRSAYPKGQKQPYNGAVLGVRNPQLKGSTTCSNKITGIDTVQYDAYLKGTSMSPDTQCNQSIVSQSDIIKFDNIKSKLVTLGQDIASKMENLYNQDNKIYEKLNMNSDKFKKELDKYKNINIQIRNELELQSNNSIEGMENLKKFKNMNDINGMLTDSDLIVLQGNYSYIMWSILAIGALTVTINIMKK